MQNKEDKHEMLFICSIPPGFTRLAVIQDPALQM